MIILLQAGTPIVTSGSRTVRLVVHNLSQRINSRGPSSSGVSWWHACSGLPSCVALVLALAASKGRKLRFAVRGRVKSRPTAGWQKFFARGFLLVSPKCCKTFRRIAVVPEKLCPLHGSALLVSIPVLIKHPLGSEGAQKEEFWAFFGCRDVRWAPAASGCSPRRMGGLGGSGASVLGRWRLPSPQNHADTGFLSPEALRVG